MDKKCLTEKEALDKEKTVAIGIAFDLNYPRGIITKLAIADSSHEIDRILKEGRELMSD